MLAEPTFGGLAIFGLVFTCNTAGNPVAYQVTGYPGVDGVQSIRLGARGGTTTIEGALAGSDPSSLGAQIAILRGLQLAGAVAVLTDQYGEAWPNVRFAEFTTGDRVFRLAENAGYATKYRCSLLHLT